VTPADPSRRLGRSAWALFAGFLVAAVLSLGTDVVLHATGLFPPWGQPMADALFVLALAYRLLYTVLSGYVTAWLAPRAPMAHVLVGGAIGTVLATLGAVATWDKGPEFGPKWYPLLLIVTAIPSVWAGGRLAILRGHVENAREVGPKSDRPVPV
jgi:hypothetical protein